MQKSSVAEKIQVLNLNNIISNFMTVHANGGQIKFIRRACVSGSVYFAIEGMERVVA